MSALLASLEASDIRYRITLPSLVEQAMGAAIGECNYVAVKLSGCCSHYRDGAMARTVGVRFATGEVSVFVRASG
jgi:hypothetical protein